MDHADEVLDEHDAEKDDECNGQYGTCECFVVVFRLVANGDVRSKQITLMYELKNVPDFLVHYYILLDLFIC